MKALDLDESLVEAHVAMAAIHLFFDWDLPGVQKELVRSKELNPNFIRIYNLEAYCFEISGNLADQHCSYEARLTARSVKSHQ